MKNRARILCILTACVLAASFGGCTKTKPTTETTQQTATGDLSKIIPKDTVTLTVYSDVANFQGEQTGWFAKILKDKFNVKFNIVKAADGVFDTRLQANNIGDIAVIGGFVKAIQANAVLDWEKDDLLKDYGPNIIKNMQAALDKDKAITETNGHIYGFQMGVGSSATAHGEAFYGPLVRWDLYKQLGYPQVNTLEDYVGVLEGMQKLQPTSENGKKAYGVSLFKDWDGNMVMFAKATAALYGYDEFGFGLYNVQKGEYQGALEEGGQYLRSLKFYNTLYQKGLLAPDSMTQTFDDVSEAYKTGGAFFNIFEWMCAPAYNTPAHLEAGKAFMPLAAKDQKNIVYGLNPAGAGAHYTIGAKTQYPELCMAIINWLSTPEGVMTVNYGPKGLTWDYKDGKPILTDLGEACQANGETVLTGDYNGMKWKDGYFTPNAVIWARDSINPDAKNGETYNYKMWTSRDSRPVSTIEQDWRTKVNATNLTKYLGTDHVAISLGTTYQEPEKSKELTTTWNQVKKEIVSGSWKAIYAKSDAEFNTIVNEMTTKAKSYGYDDCIKFSQKEAAIRKGLEDNIRKK